MPVPTIAILGLLATGAMLMMGKKKTPGAIVITDTDDEGEVQSVTEADESGNVITTDSAGNPTAQDDTPVRRTIEVTDIEPREVVSEHVYDKTLSKADQARIMNAWRVALLSQDPDKLLAIKEDIRRLAGPEAAADIDGIVATWREYAMPKGAVTKTQSGVVIETVNAAVQQQAAVEEVKDEARATGMIIPDALAPSAPKLGDATQARKVLAAKVALMVQTTTKGRENQALVRDFEAQEGLKVTGKYGFEVASKLVGYGICPPKPPFYWGRVNDFASIAREKQQYKAMLLAKAASDSSRASEWRAAAAAVK